MTPITGIRRCNIFLVRWRHTTWSITALNCGLPIVWTRSGWRSFLDHVSTGAGVLEYDGFGFCFDLSLGIRGCPGFSWCDVGDSFLRSLFNFGVGLLACFPFGN